MDESLIEQYSLETTDLLICHKIWEKENTILVFLTFGKEFHTDTLINRALDSGKKVAVPRIYGKKMKFHYIQSLNDRFEINRWNIREPLPSSPFWTPEDGPALMVTPGLAFNKKGERLGRGGGFYDRFLMDFGNNLSTVAVCFEQQIRDDIPVDKQDYKLDAVCSNSDLYLS